MSESFRKFQVLRKCPESKIITSFYLRPIDGGELAPFRPGQYLTFRIPGPDNGTALKTYSLSGPSHDHSQYRITVKREPAPSDRPDLPPGLGSNYLHDRVKAGDYLEVAPPRGDFVLDESSDRPVLLLSGGVGLTPMISMLHSLYQSDRAAWFVHACEDGASHAFQEEVDGLCVKSGGRLRRRFFYRKPSQKDVAATQFDEAGLVTADALQAIIANDDWDVYLCGPPPFMEAMYQALCDLNVAEDRIAYEFFGPETLLKMPSAPVAASESSTVPDLDDGPEVVFSKSGKSVQWDNSVESLLELAEKAGLSPEFSCRDGVCNTCKCTLLEGEVSYFQDPLDEPASGEVLICCSRPISKIVLAL